MISRSTAATREVYEQNTAAAAARVRALIDDGIRAGAFRPVSAASGRRGGDRDHAPDHLR